MPTTATITPTLGSAPVTLQAGNYSAIDDRRFWSVAAREGALSGGSYQVIQRAAGANMTVDVASSVGSGAVVQGDSVTAQGNYFVPPTAANVNVDIAASDATNPRNDLVVLEVKDDQHDAGGLNIARVRVITGTPNASAAATDAPGVNGTPALPSSCMPLAHVRVTAGATSVTTAMISDRRTWAGGTPTFVSSLPSPWVDGQEVYYQSTTAGTGGGSSNSMSSVGATWHLRARSVYSGGNASYPWEYVGGTATGQQITNTETTSSGTFAAMATAGPSVTVPLAGDYEVTQGAAMGNSGSTSGTVMSFDIGGTGAADSNGVVGGYAPFYTSDILAGNFTRTQPLTGLAASTALVSKYRCNNGGAFKAYFRFLYVRPIRVG